MEHRKKGKNAFAGMILVRMDGTLVQITIDPVNGLIELVKKTKYQITIRLNRND